MENNKKESRSSAISVGRKLKEARQTKSLTIEQVQKQTKIHSTVLIGLEEATLHNTLTDTYVRSFLKKYAQFLGLNSAEMVKEYFPAGAENAQANIVPQERLVPKETADTPKFLYMTGLAAGAIMLLVLFVFLAGKISSSLNRSKPVAQKASISATKKSQPRAVKSVQKKKPAAKTKSESKEFIPKSTPLILEIKVKDSVLVKLKRDGVLLFERVLPKGITEKIVADNSIELDIGKTQSLELILNGRPIALSGKSVIFGLEITRKGVRVR